MAKKGRSGQRKLTDAQVKNIKILLKYGNFTYSSIAKLHNVSYQSIINIDVEKTYKHIII